MELNFYIIPLCDWRNYFSLMWAQPASQIRQGKEQSTQLRDLFLFPVSTLRLYPPPHSK